MAEQLGLQQRLGDRAAVDRHERRVPAAALLVDGAGHELFARSALALHEHGDVGLGDQRHGGEDLAHPRRAADDLVETDRGLGVGGLLGVLGF